MTPSIDRTLANHGARLQNVEKQQSTQERKIDRILWLLISILAGLVFHMGFQAH